MTIKKKTATGATNANGNFSFGLPHGTVVLYAECTNFEEGDKTHVICVPYSFTPDGVGCSCYMDNSESKIKSMKLTIDVYYIDA